MLLVGSQVMNLKSWWESEAELTNKELAALKRITRASVTQLTGGRVLHTREYFKQLKSRTVIDT
jgi:hypothetical protein